MILKNNFTAMEKKIKVGIRNPLELSDETIDKVSDKLCGCGFTEEESGIWTYVKEGTNERMEAKILTSSSSIKFVFSDEIGRDIACNGKMYDASETIKMVVTVSAYSFLENGRKLVTYILEMCRFRKVDFAIRYGV